MTEFVIERSSYPIATFFRYKGLNCNNWHTRGYIVYKFTYINVYMKRRHTSSKLLKCSYSKRPARILGVDTLRKKRNRFFHLYVTISVFFFVSDNCVYNQLTVYARVCMQNIARNGQIDLLVFSHVAVIFANTHDITAICVYNLYYIYAYLNIYFTYLNQKHRFTRVGFVLNFSMNLG